MDFDDPFAYLLAVIAAGGVIFHLGCALATWYFFRRGPRIEGDAAPVSILIPIKGADSESFENWLSACRQDYPDYEVLMGVMDPDDAAVPVIRKVVEASGGRGRFVQCGPPLGINHQISNLIYLLREARHETVILMDSDIRVDERYLASVVAPLGDPKVGVVTCGYVDHAPAAPAGALASLGRCMDFIPSVLVARFLDRGMHFAIGPTIATRKAVIAAFGGLEQVVNRIGSDFHIGRMAASAGYRVELSRYVLNNPEGYVKLGSVYARESRWARTIRINRGAQYYGVVVGHLAPIAPLLVWLSEGEPWVVAVAAVSILARALQIGVSLRCISPGRLVKWIWLMPFRELMSLAVWAAGAAGNRIYWRGRNLRIQPGGILEEG